MPYVIEKNNKGEFCVFKKGDKDAAIGNSLGCHPSRKAAQRQIKALYANEPKTQEAEVPQMSDMMTVEVGGEQVALGELIEAYATLQEQKKYKTVDGERFGSEDFLVVEDPEKPTTWHLQVKRHGKADRRLMGGAKAALTSPGGHRGKKYEGPNKAEALRKLKALYKAEDMDFGESAIDVSENGDMAVYPETLSGATSFADLRAQEQAQTAADEVYKLTSQFQMLIWGIMRDSTIDDKAAQISAVADEFKALIAEAIGKTGEETSGAEEVQPSELGEADAVLAESESGEIVLIAEDGTQSASDKRAPLKLDVRLIRPGWGNKRDMHYYPADVLQRDAKVFEGAKMYVTDHRPGEKSERTEVSIIENIVRFDTDGSPIARVAVFDPEFAEKTRNRAELGQLSSLHCSILSGGKVHKGKAPDGIEGNIVEAIFNPKSVDWVTSAGAGGQAIALAESQNGGEAVNTQNAQEQQQITQEAPVAQPLETAEAQQAAPPEQVAQPVTESTPPVALSTPEPEQPTVLAEAEIDAILKASRLPQIARDRLAGETYRNADELHKVIAAELDYLKAITGSGKPFAVGQSSARDEELAEGSRSERLDAIDRKYGLRK